MGSKQTMHFVFSAAGMLEQVFNLAILRMYLLLLPEFGGKGEH
jgi:hypothetical protein